MGEKNVQYRTHPSCPSTARRTSPVLTPCHVASWRERDSRRARARRRKRGEARQLQRERQPLLRLRRRGVLGARDGSAGDGTATSRASPHVFASRSGSVDVEHERPPRVPPRREVRQRRLVPVDDGRAARAIAVREGDRVRDAVGHRAQPLRAERRRPSGTRTRSAAARCARGSTPRSRPRRSRRTRRLASPRTATTSRRAETRRRRGRRARRGTPRAPRPRPSARRTRGRRARRGTRTGCCSPPRRSTWRRGGGTGGRPSRRGRARGEGATRSASATIRVQRWGSRGLVNARKRAGA